MSLLKKKKYSATIQTLAVVATFIFPFHNALAAEALPGDSCAGMPSGTFRQSSGPEITGGHMLVCDGTNWLSVMSYNADAEVTMIGNQSCAASEVLAFDGVIWACNAAESGIWNAGSGDAIYYNSGTPLVGIGTTSPASPLHVLGDMRQRNANDGANEGIIFESENGSYTGYLQMGPAGIAAYDGRLKFPHSATIEIGNPSSRILHFAFDGNDHWRLTGNSFYPQYGYAESLTATIAAGENGSFGFYTGGSSYYRPVLAPHDATNNDNYGVKLTYKNATTLTDGLVLDNNGNVGIGTTSPQSTLHVPDGKYLQAEDNNAGTPPSGDCDADAELGRMSIDTTNNRLYVCMGASRGWDYSSLTD